MNIFRISADLMHLVSIFLLLLKIEAHKSCRGISLRTQFLYVLVFVSRYLDLFWNFHSLYNSIMKVFFIVSSVAIVYLMKFRQPYAKTYDKKSDTFRIEFLIVPSLLLAFVWNEGFTIVEILWAFSIFLESVAILPQLLVVQKAAREQSGRIENLTSHYVFCLGGYRTLYLINWAYRLLTEEVYSDWIAWIAGLVQTAVYIDFFYYYLKSRWAGEPMALPV
uniref:ER lumen protein-retaining receptor n=1 Tax=Hirondellea gigas TaxID=1518452 RepID=A0A6A7GCY2_9CRUS